MRCARTFLRWPTLSLSISPRLVISGPIDISRPPWSSLLVKQYGQAHPAERGHFKVGGEGGNYDIDSHANIEDRCKHCVNVNIFISNSLQLGNESTPYESEINVDIRLKAASTLRKQAGQALDGCKILVELFEIRSQMVIISISINY